jgi:hypothetical protein
MAALMERGDGEFVPLGEIKAGDEIVLASGGIGSSSPTCRVTARLIPRFASRACVPHA